MLLLHPARAGRPAQLAAGGGRPAGGDPGRRRRSAQEREREREIKRKREGKIGKEREEKEETEQAEKEEEEEEEEKRKEKERVARWLGGAAWGRGRRRPVAACGLAWLRVTPPFWVPVQREGEGMVVKREREREFGEREIVRERVSERIRERVSVRERED